MRMKISIKKLNDEAEDSLLNELIGKCENALVNPFKKKEEEPEEKEVSSVSEDEDSESDLSPEDLEKLLKLYEEMKG